jgi:hypothetical protein
VGEIGSERERERGKWRESVFEKVVTDDREREKVRKREREREKKVCNKFSWAAGRGISLSRRRI